MGSKHSCIDIHIHLHLHACTPDIYVCRNAHQIVMYAGRDCSRAASKQLSRRHWGHNSVNTAVAGSLANASDVYYNSGQPAIPDSLFDQLKDALHLRDPMAPFLSQIGAPVVRNRVPLPFGLYSLDKVKPGSKDLGKWQAKYPGPFCVSDKLDGTSCLIVYELSGDKWQVKLMTWGKLAPCSPPPLHPGQSPQPTPLSSLPHSTSLFSSLLPSGCTDAPIHTLLSTYRRTPTNASQ